MLNPAGEARDTRSPEARPRVQKRSHVGRRGFHFRWFCASSCGSCWRGPITLFDVLPYFSPLVAVLLLFSGTIINLPKRMFGAADYVRDDF